MKIDIPVYCVSFNHEGAYIYEPRFLNTFSYSFARADLVEESTWNTYFPKQPHLLWSYFINLFNIDFGHEVI